MADIIDLISGESLVIGDIVRDDEANPVDGLPFEDGYICYAKVVNENNKCIYGPILGEREDGHTFDEPKPFKLSIAGLVTREWSGKVTIIVGSDSGDGVYKEDGTYDYGSGTVSTKAKVYVRAEKFC